MAIVCLLENQIVDEFHVKRDDIQSTKLCYLMSLEHHKELTNLILATGSLLYPKPVQPWWIVQDPLVLLLQQQPILDQHTHHLAMTNCQFDPEYQPGQKLAPNFQEVFVARLVLRWLIVFLVAIACSCSLIVFLIFNSGCLSGDGNILPVLLCGAISFEKGG